MSAPRPACPHCGSEQGYPTMPTLMGHPVFICAWCKRVALASEWVGSEQTEADRGE
ncbi:hypothetical protein [Xylanimonas protaetiae]|uniref:hypothetical protein n=1 Tax=Xylanimonas protaetiae TaxID=2509457 RepID=UPI0013EE065A|nr:hypothetical protein [Xylanimonas protaetiae]